MLKFKKEQTIKMELYYKLKMNDFSWFSVDFLGNQGKLENSNYWLLCVTEYSIE